MIVLFTGQPGSGKTTVLSVFLKYMLDETRYRVCTIDLDYRTGKLTRILTPNIEVLCDLYDVADGVCSDVTHVVLSDRHVHIPVRAGMKLHRQDDRILDLLQELYAVLEVDLVLVDSVEPGIVAMADRRTFRVVHIVRPDIAEHYDLAKAEDVIVINNAVPGLEPRLSYGNVLYLHFDPMLKVCSDLKIMPPVISRDVQEVCRRLMSIVGRS